MISRAFPLLAWLPAMLMPILACQARDEPGCEVSVAALSLPDDSDGLLHWRTADSATTPLQLSTRYFSEPVKVQGQAIGFYKDPVPAGPPPPDAPEPLLSVRIPADKGRVFIVLWSEPDGNNQPRWQGKCITAEEWRPSSMKVINSSAEPVGIAAGDKRIQLPPGRSVDFRAAEWRQSFPVKIFQLEPELKTIFSSSWRVTAGRRELCLIGNVNGAVSLRSLLELTPPER